MKNQFKVPVSDKKLLGKVLFFHRERFSCDSAFETFEKIRIKIAVPRRLGATYAGLEVLCESADRVVYEASGEWVRLNFGYDEYEFSFPAKLIGVGLFFIRFHVLCESGKFYARRLGENILFDVLPKTCGLVQITVS